MYINNFNDFSDLRIIRSDYDKKEDEIYIIDSTEIEGSEDRSEMLTKASECLSNMGQMRVHYKSDVPSADDIQLALERMANRYEKNDEERKETKEDIISFLNFVSEEIFEDISTSSSIDEVEDAMARKAVVDYLTEHISYNKSILAGDIGFEFGLPTKKINRHLIEFTDEYDKSVALFKKYGIFGASDYDLKKHQFDAENIINKYEKETHYKNQEKYDKLFNPIERLKDKRFPDILLNSNADFYRIISPNELISLVETKTTKNFIDSNGYFTNGHYSCITTDPNYNEQAFAANGLPIRLKFKTKDSDGCYNMDLLNRICALKPERSIYQVYGYNFDDIDWDNVCVDKGNGWERLSRKCIDEIILEIQNKLNIQH